MRVNDWICFALLVFQPFLALAVILGWIGFVFPDGATVSSFMRDAIVAAITTGAALFFGIPIGLAINRRFQDERDSEERLSLLIALRDEFEANIDGLDTIKGFLTTSLHMPTFAPSVSILEGTVQRRYDLITDSDLLQSIEGAFRQLLHLKRRLDLLLPLHFETGNPSLDIAEQGHLIEQLKHFEETKDLCAQAKVFGINAIHAYVLAEKKGIIELAFGLTKIGATPNTHDNKGYPNCLRSLCQEAFDDIVNAINKECETDLGVRFD
jgi:hypothetical protein